MNRLGVTLLALACFSTPIAFAQWQWIDKDSRKVFSDQAPPPGTPADKIVKRPGNRPAEAEPAVAPAASNAAANSVPKVSGKDKALEDRKKQAAAAEADKKKAQDEEIARVKADNCTRAKQAKTTIDSGMRIAVVNDKGEREVMDDRQREAESKRLDGLIVRNCN